MVDSLKEVPDGYGVLAASSRWVVLDPEKVASLQGTRTLAEFARDSKVSVDALHHALNGHRVERSTWANLAKFNGVADPDWLLLRTLDDSGIELPDDEALRQTLPRCAMDVRLDRAAIQQLAEHIGLFQATESNPSLVYQVGDISYWEEQPEEQRRALALWAEFLARRLTLVAADSEARRVPSQGDLSHAAQPLVARLREWAREHWPHSTHAS